MLATSTDGADELMDMLGADVLDSTLFPPVAPQKWLQMYRCHWQAFLALLEPLKIDDEAKARATETVNFVMLAQERLQGRTSERVSELLKRWMRTPRGKAWANQNESTIRQAFQAVVALSLCDLSKVFEEVFDAEIARKEILESGAFAFLATVYLPCIIYTGHHPTRLFHKARTGDIDALCALLRIDKGVMSDPLIGKVVRTASLSEPLRFDDIQQAFAAKRKSISVKALKERFAGLMAWTASDDPTFNCSTIRDVFDFAECIKTGNLTAHDPHITAGETFSKAVQRNKKRIHLGRGRRESKKRPDKN